MIPKQRTLGAHFSFFRVYISYAYILVLRGIPCYSTAEPLSDMIVFDNHTSIILSMIKKTGRHPKGNASILIVLSVGKMLTTCPALNIVFSYNAVPANLQHAMTMYL